MVGYYQGDATYPRSRPAIIAHVCNNKGGWGRGFVLSISKRWRGPEQFFRASAKRAELGDIQVSRVEETVWVANMIAQNGYQSKDNPIPLDYRALRSCLQQVATLARQRGASVHMPRIGCGLAGGSWETVEKILQDVFSNIEVYVYSL